MLGAQIFTIVISSCWIDPWIIMQCPSLSLVIFILMSFLSDMRIATPAFLCFPFAWNTVFHPLTFSLYVFRSEVVSSRQHIYGSCFCIRSASLCLLVETFNPFTFKVIIDPYTFLWLFTNYLGLILQIYFLLLYFLST